MGNTAHGLEQAHKCSGIDKLISQLTTDTLSKTVYVLSSSCI